MRRYRLPRRTLLKGLLGGTAVSVGLPALDMFLNNHGTAYADGSAFPARFGLWFWGNGVQPDRWVPETTGPGWCRIAGTFWCLYHPVFHWQVI